MIYYFLGLNSGFYMLFIHHRLIGMSDNSVGIIGLTRQYPEFKYSTKEMIDVLGNKLTEKVKENIFQLQNLQLLDLSEVYH